MSSHWKAVIATVGSWTAIALVIWLAVAHPALLISILIGAVLGLLTAIIYITARLLLE